MRPKELSREQVLLFADTEDSERLRSCGRASRRDRVQEALSPKGLTGCSTVFKDPFSTINTIVFECYSCLPEERAEHGSIILYSLRQLITETKIGCSLSASQEADTRVIA